MTEKIATMQTRLKLISAIILLAGLGSAVFIYLTAENDVPIALGYEAVGGDVYPVTPDNSKMYLRDLELFGGKAAVLANEFRYWFAGLWHGKTLAFTVACMTIFAAFAVFFVADHLPSDTRSPGQGDDDRHGKYFNP